MTPLATLPPTADCWNAIGVTGDGSCPELLRVTHCRNCPVFAAAGQRLYERPPPTGYTDDWTDRIAAADPPPPPPTIPVVLFQVADEWLALDVADTVEVSPLRTVRRVPHQSDALLAGLVNIRGELQLAIALGHLLGIGNGTKEPADPARRRLLVVERGGGRWVFLVDAVYDIFHFRRTDLGDLPATVAAGGAVYCRGVFRWKERAVGYLDADRLFPALKRSFR